MILSILIPTLPERIPYFAKLMANLSSQIKVDALEDMVEIISDSRDRQTTTGEKRNDLIEKANGVYVWHVDDDDYIFDYALVEIIEASKTNPDVICFNGYMTTQGVNRVDFELRLGHPYCATVRDGKQIYLRYPNHIVPIKKECIKDIPFKSITIGEDFDWATRVRDSGVLKTEAIIDKDIYHYQFRHK